MQLSDATHEYACTPCTATGGLCLEGVWLARRLATGLAQRAAILPSDFTYESRACFGGCGGPCEVRVRLAHDRIEVASDPHDARVVAVLRPTLAGPAVATG